MRRIDKVGVELEGGWYSKPKGLKRDRSLRRLGAEYVGEVVSRPYPLSHLRYLVKWIEKNYPDCVNDSCGFHIHISLHSLLDYSHLANEQFESYLFDHMKKWGKTLGDKIPRAFWDRIRGENDYCNRFWCPAAQFSATLKFPNRYTSVNFPYVMNGTVEFRFLPMFDDYEIAIQAIYQIIEVVEDYLKLPKEDISATYTTDGFVFSMKMEDDGLHVFCKQDPKRLESLAGCRVIKQNGIRQYDVPDEWGRKYGFWGRYLKDIHGLGRFPTSSMPTDYYLGWFVSPDSITEEGLHHVITRPHIQEQLDDYLSLVIRHIESVTRDFREQKQPSE